MWFRKNAPHICDRIKRTRTKAQLFTEYKPIKFQLLVYLDKYWMLGWSRMLNCMRFKSNCPWRNNRQPYHTKTAMKRLWRIEIWRHSTQFTTPQPAVSHIFYLKVNWISNLSSDALSFSPSSIRMRPLHQFYFRVTNISSSMRVTKAVFNYLG